MFAVCCTLAVSLQCRADIHNLILHLDSHSYVTLDAQTQSIQLNHTLAQHMHV